MTTTNIDLDELERKAHAAESDEWQWRPANGDILEGKHNAQIVLAGDDLICSASDREHIAANSPPVTLALIARIRELEGAIIEMLDDALSQEQLHELLAKGVTIP